MIKMDDLAAFVAVMRSESVSLAAESLQLTQPAITRRLQSLEETLDVSLFDRNTKPLKATAIGLRIYEQCRVILREVDALQDLVESDSIPTGILRIGVPQTISDVVLLDVLQEIREVYPTLLTRVLNGWGASLMRKVEHGELDAACALLPVGTTFPEGVAGSSLLRMQLLVVAAKGTIRRKQCRLSDCYEQGWVLNPDGCGFRAGLQRALTEQGLPFKLNLETFGSELQLGLVAEGVGLGLVPDTLLDASSYREQLDIVNVTDFRPVLDLWLIHPRYVGNLHGPIQLIGKKIVQCLGGE